MPKGSCLCHQLQYEYQGDPLMKGPCYCLSCRKISGSTNTFNLLLPHDKLSITSGTPKQYTEMHESGEKLTVFFCENCGSSVYKTHGLFPEKVVLLAGTLDDADGLEQAKPQVELFVKHRPSWLHGLDWADQKMEF
ncbi:GFA domain-containing protein [Penicillium ucsense]|uniref:GFA domain-containing protein n=1 Tax=Penicillium ucsense TaxID=2839758 RepID=A0A8J8W498_9EURO|nr:GFA domain-containing protein [Penicillium ucsense]KAF7739603.1 GFA domain-containing protein [Penicillium ucsense]